MPSVPDEILLALVVSVVAEAAKPETAPDAMAIPVGVTLVTCPCALVVKTGTEAAPPYVPAVPVLAILNVKAGDSFSPVPAVYVIGAANCWKTSAVVPTVIGGAVCCTQAVLVLATPPVTKKKSPSSIWLTPDPAVSKSVARVSMYGVPAVPTCVTTYTPLFACVASFFTSTLLAATVSVESTDKAPLAFAVSVAPTPDVPLLYVFAGRAAVVANSTASWK